MKLLTKEIEETLPRLYSQEKVEDPIVHVRFFATWSNWTWYATEGERQEEDFIFFGYVQGFEGELGYFSLAEMESGRGYATIERDLYFTPKPLSEALKRDGRSR